MDTYWIEEIRNIYLTKFFLIFPFFTSIHFYISSIAIGYWLRPGGKTFVHLGFLIPFATIIAIILNNSLQIVRPPVELQLINYDTAFGFPNSELFVSVIFWGVLMHRSKHFFSTLIPLLLLICIGFSYIYLGAYTVESSIAGFYLGLLLMGFWYRADVQAEISNWFSYDARSFWGIYLLCFVTYLTSYESDLFISEVAMSLGVLLGYGLSITSMRKWQITQNSYSIAHFRAVILCYILLLVIAYILPMIEITENTMFASTMIEFAILAILIFAIFPRIIKNEITKYEEKKSSNIEHDPGHDMVVNYKSLTS